MQAEYFKFNSYSKSMDYMSTITLTTYIIELYNNVMRIIYKQDEVSE